MRLLTKWLILHPLACIALGAVALIAFVLWLAAPVTWRDGEGPLMAEDDNLLFWWLKRWFP